MIGGWEKGKLAILVDESSASASEIVSGAIQDWDRGLIIGRRSFGKGLVQKPYQLPDGSAIRLTVAHYYTPSGRNIQKPYKLGEEEEYEFDSADDDEEDEEEDEEDEDEEDDDGEGDDDSDNEGGDAEDRGIDVPTDEDREVNLITSYCMT